MIFSEKVSIQNKIISEDSPVFIIAEVGVNHNGSMDLAFKLIDEAKKCKADCVKFQTFNTNLCESKYALKPDYFSGREKSIDKKEFSKSLEFDKAQFRDLKMYCDEIGIIFLSMAADSASLELLVDIGCPGIKIGSSDTLNFPLFNLIGKTGLPVFYSTGISTFEDVNKGVEYLYKSGVKELAVLQCTSQYPAPYQDINLSVIDLYKNSFNVPVGFSDHSEGIHIPYAAVAKGAKIIEKHFTLDKNLPGVDHLASTEPSDFSEMVKRIREVEESLGDGIKKIRESEEEHLLTMRKSLFSISGIKKGEKFTLENIGAKRPGSGILPSEIDKFLGKTAGKNIGGDEFITWDMLE